MTSTDGSSRMFFVIGAQKSGTTWLHSWISTHPEVSTGPVKEYSYFSKFHPKMSIGDVPLPRFQWLRRKSAMASVLKRAGLASGYGPAFVKALFGDYVYKQIVTGSGQPKAFGDISPFYSLLGRSAYAEMASLHPSTRFIFIMRDPVERLWSQLRMRAKETGGTTGASNALGAEIAEWDQPRNLMRSRYDRTIAELEAAVPPDDILYLFYEDLFQESTLRHFTNFIGVSPHQANLEKRVHASIAADMPEAWRTRARERLSPVYSFVKSKFGDRVPLSWDRSAMYQAQNSLQDD